MSDPGRTGEGGQPGRFMAGLRHAFSLGPPGPAVPSEEERDTLDRVLREVVRRGMSGPAILFLDSARPLNAVSAAAVHFLTPIAGAVVDQESLRRIAGFLERRGSFEWMVSRLEELEAEASSRVAKPEGGDLGAKGGAGALQGPGGADQPSDSVDR